MSQSHVPSRPPTNGLGIAGFIVSLVGLVLTCGILCPLGLLLSLIALFKPPRGFAVAGTVIGLLGSMFFVVAGFGMFRAAVGLQKGIQEHAPMLHTGLAGTQAIVAIENERKAVGALPDETRGNELVGAFTDGWHTPLRYELTGATFQIRSAGEDADFGTADDKVIPATGQGR